MLKYNVITHRLESGAELRYIQVLLGHKNSKTTEINTHVSNKDIGRIKSPLDSLDVSLKNGSVSYAFIQFMYNIKKMVLSR